MSSTAESAAQSPLCLLVLAQTWGVPDLALACSSSIAANCTISLDGGSRITEMGTEVGGVVTGNGRNNIGPATRRSHSLPAKINSAGRSRSATAPSSAAQMSSCFFGFHSSANLSSSAQISLAGRRTGPHAGFVLMTTHSTHQAAMETPFPIQTDAFSSITGTVYSPNIPLQREGGARAAQSSDWTVIVASALRLTERPGANGYPIIQMNANYGGSAAPVPG